MKLRLRILSRLKDAWNYRNEPEEATILLGAYWRCLLLLVVAVCACALLFGGWELAVVASSESAGPPAVPTGSSPIDEAQLEATLESFNERQSGYQELSQSPAPALADPSQ